MTYRVKRIEPPAHLLHMPVNAESLEEVLNGKLDEYVGEGETLVSLIYRSDGPAQIMVVVRQADEPPSHVSPTLRTPLHIRLLIHCCVLADPMSAFQQSAPAVRKYLDELEEWGAIEPDGNGWYRGTDLGRRWLHQMPRPE